MQCRYAHLFSQAEINLMEKQLLYLLDYDLAITTEEVHTRTFSACCSTIVAFGNSR
jgi:hypothetical protein